VADLPAGLKVESFDHLFQENEPTPQALEEIVSTLLKLGQGENGSRTAYQAAPWLLRKRSNPFLMLPDKLGLK